MQAIQFVPDGPAVQANRSLARVLDAVGSSAFPDAMLGHLQSRYGVDHFAAYRLDDAAPHELAACSYDGSATARQRVDLYLRAGVWARDPAMTRVRRGVRTAGTLMARIDTTRIGDPDLREALWPRIGDRVVLGGRAQALCISLLREHRQRFGDADLQRIGDDAELLLGLVRKHVEFHGRADVSSPAGALRPSATGRTGPNPLACVDAIERTLARSSRLTPRERQVCARILHGMSTAGIALDLGVSAETVKTFRKLAYRKQRIGTQRQLLDWYLALTA